MALSPKSDREFREIKIHLETLTLGTEDVPSLQKFRMKYKQLLRKHHPDKGGDVEVAKELTAAARAVLEYLTTHPKRVPDDGTDDQIKEDREHLKVFEHHNNLKENDGNMTFNVDV